MAFCESLTRCTVAGKIGEAMMDRWHFAKKRTNRSLGKLLRPNELIQTQLVQTRLEVPGVAFRVCVCHIFDQIVSV